MRVTSEIWVGALVKRANANGAFAVVAKRGAKEAGAIFVVVAKTSDNMSLFVPALQTQYSQNEARDTRRFALRLSDANDSEVQEILAREQNFDADMWIVEIEDRDGRSFIEDEIVS